MHKLFTGATFFGVLILALFFFNNAISSQQLASASASYTTADFHIDENAKSDILELPVSAFAIFDVETGEILVSKNSGKKLPIASVTKLVTAASAMDNLDLDLAAIITASDVLTEGKAGKLQAGEKYSQRELLFPLLLESSNDAAVVFERVTDDGIISGMNSFVENLGATQTSFADASGLSSRNISTAEDLALVTTYLYENQPHVFDMTKLPQYVGPYTGWVNNNPVIEKDNYLGGKHGFTHAAKLTIVSLFEEDFVAESRAIGYVVLGSSDLRADISALRQFTTNSISFE